MAAFLGGGFRDGQHAEGGIIFAEDFKMLGSLGILGKFVAQFALGRG
jgi:hypothetical protein